MIAPVNRFILIRVCRNRHEHDFFAARRPGRIRALPGAFRTQTTPRASSSPRGSLLHQLRCGSSNHCRYHYQASDSQHFVPVFHGFILSLKNIGWRRFHSELVPGEDAARPVSLSRFASAHVQPSPHTKSPGASPKIHRPISVYAP